jgi:hypothetical protein
VSARNEGVRRQDAARLFAVLVGDNGPLCRTGVGAQNDAIFEETADDGCARASRDGLHNALVRKMSVPVNTEMRKRSSLERPPPPSTHRVSFAKSNPERWWI